MKKFRQLFKNESTQAGLLITSFLVAITLLFIFFYDK